MDCAIPGIKVTVSNSSTAARTYRVAFTPDAAGSMPVTGNLTVGAGATATYSLAVPPTQTGKVDVGSDDDVVIGGQRIEVKCASASTTTITPTTVAPTTVAPATSVAAATTIKASTPPTSVSATPMLATTGSTNLPLIGIGVSMFMIGLILLELRTVRPAR